MKYLIFVCLLAFLLAVYLHYAYKRIYDYRPSPGLTSPYYKNTYNLDNPGGGKAVKYTALGDSLTAGVGSADYRKTFPYLLAKQLSSKSPVALINLAFPGADAHDVLTSQLPKAISDQPEFISLLIGVNDIHNLRSKTDFERDYRQIVDGIIQKTTAKLVLINIPYLGQDALVWPPYNFLFDLRTRQFNSIIAGVAQEKKIRYIDVYHLVSFNSPDLYSSDEFHPSEKGYLLLGDVINANYNP